MQVELEKSEIDAIIGALEYERDEWFAGVENLPHTTIIEKLQRAIVQPQE